ncbi:HlyD family secretion protein [Hyphomicrobium denitrificans 1NES1]|uniref:HlyD family secretion protein n=1 Tax=Hyphomicrobium denitrificans 1NES1 TaxID=670307 RepID=N0BEK1_9HYPH|nr:efflux RND transporter periplasmic adaptor subunit [Hyphomicrobium denitrificans]AGK58520.1 HlyD family secretion protein [Hyphomicrobium denitrificans 1NES1]
MFVFPGSRRRSLFHETYFILALLLGATWLGASEGSAQRAGKRGDILPAVTLSDVKIERMNERVAAVGSGRARQQVTLTTRVAGVIDQVLFEGGQLVEANQALVKLNADTEAIAVETAQAQRAQAADTVARYKQLNEGTITKVAVAEADTALKVADANLRKAKDELDRMTIKAPFKGIMGLSTLEAGDYLAVGSPIATIDDRSTILIEFTVPEAVASSMKVGIPVRANLITRSGEIIDGKIQAVGTRIDPVSRTLVVRAEIPNPDLGLIPGSTFSISVQLPGQDSPVVPSLAIQWDRQGAFVWRVTDQNAVERVNAAILDRNGDRVYIDAKLKAGDKIVGEGGSSLRDGQTVRPQSS